MGVRGGQPKKRGVEIEIGGSRNSERKHHQKKINNQQRGEQIVGRREEIESGGRTKQQTQFTKEEWGRMNLWAGDAEGKQIVSGEQNTKT